MVIDISIPPFVHPHANFGYTALLTLQALVCKRARDTWILPVELEPEQTAIGSVRIVSTCYMPAGYLGSPLILLDSYRVPSKSVPLDQEGRQEGKRITLKPVEPSKIFTDPRSNMQAFVERNRGLTYNGAQLSFDAVLEVFQSALPSLHPKLVGFARARDNETLATQGAETDVATFYFMLRDEAPLDPANPDGETVAHYFKLLWSSPVSFNSQQLTKK